MNMETIAVETPRWLSELRRQCAIKPQSKVAKELGYSSAVVSQVLAGKYKGNIQRVSETICSVYLGETVICPVMGELEKHRCRRFQQETFSAVNPLRVRRYRACRSGCINSELESYSHV
jgi:DNA-binding transcriptional regulator YdaS (Cro superfamily)